MTGPKQIWPTIRYDDAPAAIRFLVDLCGFEERLVVKGDGDREIEHAQLAWPEGGGVMLGSRATAEGAEFNTERVGVSVVTDDGFSLRDAGGNAWTFGSYRGE